MYLYPAAILRRPVVKLDLLFYSLVVPPYSEMQLIAGGRTWWHVIVFTFLVGFPISL